MTEEIALEGETLVWTDDAGRVNRMSLKAPEGRPFSCTAEELADHRHRQYRCPVRTGNKP